MLTRIFISFLFLGTLYVNGQSSAVNYWPETVDNNLSIDLEEYKGNNIFVKIFDKYGQILYQRNIQQRMEEWTISLSNIKSGNYFLFIKDELISKTFKLKVKKSAPIKDEEGYYDDQTFNRFFYE